MGVDVNDQTPNVEAAPPRASLDLRALAWRDIVMVGLAAGALLPPLLFNSTLFLFSGIIPVLAGVLLGRRVKSQYAWNGFLMGLVGTLAGMGVLALLVYGAGWLMQAPGPDQLPRTLSAGETMTQSGLLIVTSLIPFGTFGAMISGRSEQRNREARAQLELRGGRIERPGAVRTVDDVRGLSLPQLGGYVSNLFRRQGFTVKDYRFTDKDRYLDLWMEHEGAPWLVRATTVDKVKGGTVLDLLQKMKAENIEKAVVIANTEFQPDALKNARGRPVVLVDAQTLFEIAE